MSVIRAALQSALAFATNEMNKPCNHHHGDARQLAELLAVALVELDEADDE